MINSISIIVPSLNEFDSVEKMIFNVIDTIELDDYEIIIVNSGGTETSAIQKLPKFICTN